jgi:hypothetical protein
MSSRFQQTSFLSPALEIAFRGLIDAHENPSVEPDKYREAVEALRGQVKVEREKTDQMFEFINQLLDGISARSRARGDGRPEDWRVEELASWLQRVLR